VVRARPDHIFLQPLDLRHFGLEHSKRPMVVKARGHFIRCTHNTSCAARALG
jgi:hypothetical protein